jgi:hypothetical protein
MTKYTRRDKQRLAPEIIAKFHDAGQRGDVAVFKRLLAEYGAHLPRQVKDELIADFKRNADALRAALREKG